MAKAAKTISHKSEASMKLITAAGKEVNIDDSYITSVSTDYKYSENLMPILYAILDVTVDLYDKIIKNASDGKIYLQMKNYNAKEENAIHKNTVNGQFLYFVPTQYNSSNELEDTKINEGTKFKHIVLGLMKPELIQENKTAFNGVWTDTDSKEMIQNFLGSTGNKVVMDDIQMNTDFDAINIPPQESVANAIDYVFQTEPFYGSDYQFFMDLDKTYLLDSSGKKRDVSSMPSIIIKVMSVGEKNAYQDGVIRDGANGAYTLYVNEADVQFSINTTTEKSTNQIVGVQTDQVTQVDLDINAKNPTSSKVTFEADSGKGVTDIKKQIMENTSVSLEITKQNLDTKIITPDKSYNVQYGDYKQYNGVYLLQSKNEILGKTGKNFDTTTSMKFVRIAAQ